MKYTIIAANYTDELTDTAIINTKEAGSIFVDRDDYPEVWADMLKWGTPSAYKATTEPAAFTVYKADIWRRCTDDEAGKLDAAIRAQPVRLRRLFDDATNLRSDDELFGQVNGAVLALLGADRAAAILAPSEGY